MEFPEESSLALWDYLRLLGSADSVLSSSTTGPLEADTLCGPVAVGRAGTIMSLPTPSSPCSRHNNNPRCHWTHCWSHATGLMTSRGNMPEINKVPTAPTNSTVARLVGCEKAPVSQGWVWSSWAISDLCVNTILPPQSCQDLWHGAPTSIVHTQ